MSRKLTQQEFEKSIKDLYGEELTILGQYNGRREKILVRHNCELCENHEWEVLPGNLFKSIPCPRCYDINRRKGTDEFKNEVKTITNGEYLFMGDYKNNKTPSKFYHVSCGREFTKRPDQFSNGQRCPHCELENRGLSKRKSHEEFLEKCNKLPHIDEYIILGTYEKSDIEIEIYHKICEKSFWITPNNFLSGVRCSHCYKKHRKTTEKIKKEINDKTNGEYSLISEYVNSKTNVLIKHNKCGHKWWTKASYIIQGHGCEKCCSSKGEKKITKWLKKHIVSYEPEFTFDELTGVGDGKLPFDFAITNNVGNIITLIEYDGEQHYKCIPFYGGENGFAKRIIHDALKNAYCEDNNIPLLRIPFWEFNNIEQILNDYLNKLINLNNAS